MKLKVGYGFYWVTALEVIGWYYYGWGAVLLILLATVRLTFRQDPLDKLRGM